MWPDPDSCFVSNGKIENSCNEWCGFFILATYKLIVLILVHACKKLYFLFNHKIYPIPP